MDQHTTLEILKSGHNVFLTGAPGTGKTYVVNQYISYLHEHGVFPALVAPTGIAASHINGQTIHSFFGLGIKDEITEEDVEKILQKPQVMKNLKKMRVLIIDEISMLSPLLLDAIDLILRSYHVSLDPFGGIQVIFSGDFFQLPPVRSDPQYRFAWQSHAWQRLDPVICYLQKSYRQQDDPLLELLQEIRGQRVSEDSMDMLRKRYRRNPEHTNEPTKLYTHNADIDRINYAQLRLIPGGMETFDAECSGNGINVERIFKSSLVARELDLKKGAQVMFIKNSIEQGYINGTMGTVIDFEGREKTPVVETFSGRIIKVQPQEWNLEDHNGKIIASVSQIPLKLAWAITVHKSQGMTLDTAEIDLSKTFELGQGYVALSRLKSIHGLKLMGMNDIALKVDDTVYQQDEEMMLASQNFHEEWETYSGQSKGHTALQFLLSIGGSEDIQAIATKKFIPEKRKPTLEETKDLLAQGKNLEEIATTRGIHIRTVLDHIRKLALLDKELPMEHLKPDRVSLMQITNAVEEIASRNDPKDYLETGKMRLRNIYDELNGEISYDSISLGILFIDEKLLTRKN